MKTLLIVDDDENIRLLLRDEFAELDYNVITAVDGEEGLVTFDEENVDLVVLDLQMPKLDGAQVLEQLRKKTLDIPIIIYTANPEMASELKVWANTEVLYKSASLNQLVETVNSYLGN